MPFKFDNSISWMDVATLLSATAFVSAAFFTLEGGVISNTEKIDRNSEDIQRVKESQADSNREITRLIERNRVEAKADNQRLDAKLDKILERVMER